MIVIKRQEVSSLAISDTALEGKQVFLAFAYFDESFGNYFVLALVSST